MNLDRCLEILNERAQQPQNSLEDMPKVDNLNISGQSHVFTSSSFFSKASSSSSSSIVSPTKGAEGQRGGSETGVNAEEEESAGGQPAITAEGELAKIEEMDSLGLLNLFTTLQEDRVQTYKVYNRIFRVLLENAQLTQYPLLCSEMTSRFSIISKYIIKIKEGLESSKRGRKDLAKVISRIQENEKEKLTVMAAIHLDKIKSKMPALHEQLSQGVYEHIDGGDYLSKKIQQLEESISEDVEEIQLAKSENSI